MGTLSCGMWVLVPWPGGSSSLLGEHGVLAAGTPGKAHPCHFFCCILLNYLLSGCPGDYKLTYNDLVQINTKLTTVVYRNFVSLFASSFVLCHINYTFIHCMLISIQIYVCCFIYFCSFISTRFFHRDSSYCLVSFDFSLKEFRNISLEQIC